ncbi:hypothetical protein GF360_02900 [candidate division WWE3 bacterium]|nr:hypothetical protein [candidate division WWE3 bacterium]
MNFKCTYNIEKEVDNYVEKLLKNKDLKLKDELLKTTNPEIQKMLSKEKTPNAKQQLTKYFQKYYNQNIQQIEQKEKLLNKAWQVVGNQIIYTVESLYKRKFPFKNLIGFYTTLPIYPYSYENKYTYVGLNEEIPEQLMSILHELNHFMFHHYFGHLRDKLKYKKFHLIKESLTFFTNPEDPGLKNQEDLRVLYASKYWENIDDAISAAVRKIEKE